MKSIHTKESLKDMTKEKDGITLLALVVTIIVLLILAGVTISSITGNNGILTRTKEAVVAQDEANRREYLDQLMLEYSMDRTSKDEGITDFLNKLKADGRIQDFAYYDGELVLKYGGYYYLAEREGSFYKIARRLDTEIDGGSILISRNNIKNAEGGKITLKDKDSVVVIDTVKADNFNFDIPANSTVTIKLMDDMNIDNENNSNRSAINLNENSTLNLYIYGNTTVNSSIGAQGGTTVWLDDPPQKNPSGGYAGIHVPETATLNLYGTGTLYAIGGSAGDGGSYIKKSDGSDDHPVDLQGCTGGGGAGAGIGGNGGTGGIPTVGEINRGDKGSDGEKAGKINISNLTVYAYGGKAGSGGSVKFNNLGWSGGAGGGGYPGAGIGGGRSWWSCRKSYKCWWRFFSRTTRILYR